MIQLYRPITTITLPHPCGIPRVFSVVTVHFCFHYRSTDNPNRCFSNHFTQLNNFLSFSWSSSFYPYMIKIATSESPIGALCEGIYEVRVDLWTSAPVCASQTLGYPEVSHGTCQNAGSNSVLRWALTHCISNKLPGS